MSPTFAVTAIPSSQPSSAVFGSVVCSLGLAASPNEGHPRSVPSSVNAGTGTGTGTSPSALGVEPEVNYEEVSVNSIAVAAAKSRVLRAMLFNGMAEWDRIQAVIVRVTDGGETQATLNAFGLDLSVLENGLLVA